MNDVSQMLAVMQFDVSIISTNEYPPEEMINKDIPEKYLYDDNGNFCFASTILDSERTITQLINFLFQGNSSAIEVFRDQKGYVLDLSACRKQVIDLDYLEQNYSKWIEETGRENTMNEYGILLDFIGFTKNGLNKKYLLMIVSKKLYSN